MPAESPRSGLALRPRERRLALVAAGAIGCWVALSWVVHPLWDRLRTLRLRMDTQTEKLAALSRLLEAAPAIEREYAAATPYLASGADRQAQERLLHELETLSRQTRVQLNLKPRPVKRDERGSRFEVELDVEGAQELLLAFLDALFQMPRLMTIERLRMFTAPANPSVLRANLVIQALAFTP